MLRFGLCREGGKRLAVALLFVALFVVPMINSTKMVQAAGFSPRLTVINSEAPEIEPEQDNSGEVEWITGQEYWVGSGEEAVLSIAYDLRLFTALRVDGRELTLFEDYMLEEGSTVIVFDTDYMVGLELGRYEVEAEYTDGKVFRTDFEVIDPATIDGESGSIVVPDTGDNYMEDGVGGVLVVPVIVIAALVAMGGGLYVWMRRPRATGVRFDRIPDVRNKVADSYHNSFSMDYRRKEAGEKKVSSKRPKMPKVGSGLTLSKISAKTAAIATLAIVGGLGVGINLIHALANREANATLVEDVESLAITATDEVFTREVDLSDGTVFVSTYQDVSIDAATRNGYQLFISTNSDQYNDLSINGSALGDARMSASTGTLGNPEKMEGDRWGYALDTEAFGDDRTSADGLWAGVPVFTTKVAIKTVYGATLANDRTRVYYGFNVTNNLPDGVYWGTENSSVLYTAVANVVPDYTITYDCNGGTGTTEETATMGNVVRLGSETTCTRTGYTLAGWNTVYNGSGKDYAIGSRYQIFNNLYLYAMWNIDGAGDSDHVEYNYTLSYNANGGSGAPETQAITSTEDEVTFTVSDMVPEYEGHTFLGWRLNNNGRIYNASDTITVNKLNSTLYAVWRSDEDGSESGTTTTVYTYTLQYNANGRGEAPATQTETTPDTAATFVISSDSLMADGYVFKGWSLSSTATEASILPGTNYTTTKTDVTLYAVWAKEYNYELSYNLNGGTGNPPTTQTVTSTAGSMEFTVANDNPQRDGFVFLGWSKSSDATVADVTPGRKITLDSSEPAIVLYAVWTAEYNYRLEYNANGGDAATVPDASIFKTTNGQHYFVVSDVVPRRDGFRFAGWSTNSGAVTGDLVSGDRVLVTSGEPSKVLYAVWQQENQFTLSYNANGGSGAPATQTTLTTGSSVWFMVSNVVPTWSGHNFLGWSTNSAATVPDDDYRRGQWVEVTVPNTVLYAVWEEAGEDPYVPEEVKYTYTLHFDANGGTGTLPDDMTGQTTENSYIFTVPGVSSVSLTRDGYELIGWSTNRYATTAEVGLGGGNYTATRFYTTLYAVWAVKYNYAIVYDLKGGTNGPENVSYATTATSWTTNLSNVTPTNGNYVFKGWSTSSAATSVQYGGGAEVTLNGTTGRVLRLYAVWEAQYTHGLMYDMNGGSEGPANDVRTSAQYTETFIVGSDPTRSDAVFKGWAESRSGAVKYHAGDSISISGDRVITLYAIWELQYTYKLTYNANGGDASSVPAAQSSGAVTATSYTFDVNTTKKPTRSGYTFLGWAKNSAATTAEYAVNSTGQKITVSSANTTIYAVWKKDGPVLVTKITISGGQNIDYNGANTTQLSASVTPSNAANKSITWGKCPTDNASTTSVSSAGKVKGINSGESCIQATANDGSGVYARYNVYVKKKVIIIIGASQVTRMAGADCDPEEDYRYECRLVNGKYRIYADIQSYKAGDHTYKRNDTLYFANKSGTDLTYLYEDGWDKANEFITKYEGDRKMYTDFYVYFLIPGNGVKEYICDNISESNTTMLNRAMNINKVVQNANNSGYRVHGYVGSSHPLRPDLVTKSDSKVVMNNSPNACKKEYRSNLKYYTFNRAMKKIVDNNYSSNLRWVSMFIEIMDVNKTVDGDYVLQPGWTDYKTVNDGVHWTDATTVKYFNALLNKNSNL